MQNPPTVGLKWSALAIVLSKHSPEIAAEYANTSVALDCADPEVLKRWNDAVHSPTEEQQSKQVGYEGKGKEVAGPTDSERQEMRWTEERSDGTLRKVWRQTTSVDSQNRTAVVQQAEVNATGLQVEMLQTFTLKQFTIASKNFEEISKVCSEHHVDINNLKLAQHTHDEKMRLTEENVREMKLQRSHDKLMQTKREKDMEEFKSTIKKARLAYEREIKDMRMEHEKEMSDANEHCRSLNVELGMCKLAMRDQVKREKKFDQDHENNCKTYDNAINALINRVADLEDGMSKGTSSKGALSEGASIKATSSKCAFNKSTSSKPTSRKPTSIKPTSIKPTSSKDGIPNTQTTVEQVAESMVADTVREHHVKVNGNHFCECRQPETSRKRQSRMEDVIGHACDDQVGNHSQKALQRSEASLKSVLDKNLFSDRLKMDYQTKTEFTVYKDFDYDPVDYFTSGEFAKDEAKGIIFPHPLYCITMCQNKNAVFPYVKMGTGRDVIMREKFLNLQQAFEARRNACIDHPHPSQSTNVAKKNFQVNKRAKFAHTVVSSSSSNPQEGCSSQAPKRTSNDGRGGGAQQSKRPRVALNDAINSRDKNFIEAAYERADFSTDSESEMERCDDDRDKDYQP